jgi:probable F420-dependent oxidoreductase
MTAACDTALVQIGVTVFQTDRCPPPALVARAAEERGFSSYYVPEHTHLPVSRATPWPMGSATGAELPAGYARILDPYVALATAAAVTSRIRLGTGVALVAEHDPVVLAKEVATLDFLSDGRVTLGVGFGWNKEEMATHGVTFADRRAVVRDHMLLMRALWRDDVASYDGPHARLEPAWSWPKPVQRPGVPVLVGGAAGPKLFAGITEWADGWMPFGGTGLTDALPQLRLAWADAGRGPDGPQVVVFGSKPDRGKFEHFAALGVDEVVLAIDDGDESAVQRSLDDLAAFL